MRLVQVIIYNVQVIQDNGKSVMKRHPDFL